MRKTADAAQPLSSRQTLYRALWKVNGHFDRIREHIEQLRRLGMFRSRTKRALLNALDADISEARAWFNAELLEAQGEAESREWARLDRFRSRREKRSSEC